MAGTKRFAFNVMMNWAAMAVSMVVPFFLTPFVVRHLGATAYGIWILAVSTVSYLNLLDFGLRSAVIRFVSKATAQHKPDEATSAIGAALWFRLIIAAGVALLSVGLAFAFPHMFKVPRDLQSAAQITVLLCALGVGITLVSGVFGAVLAAINRFDILSSVSMVQTVARAIGVITILGSGHGLVTLAYWELTVVLLSGVITCGVALRFYAPCRVRIERPDMTILRKIWAYSFTTFIFMIAVQVIVNTDNLVVGAFLSVGVVAFYSIGSSLIGYTAQVVGALSTTFTPLASGLEASGRSADLQRLLLRGTQASLALVMPISLALLFRGRTFIALWMGPQYSHVSGTVLQILMISLFFAVADSTAGSIMMAIDKHKPVARWAVYEAVLNLGLSLILVKTIGLYGVALGTTIAMTLVHVLFWPRYVHKVLGVPIRTFLWEGWAKVPLCALPYALVCFLADRYWHASNLAVFLGQIIVTLPIYAVCLLLLFRNETRNLFLKWKNSRVLNPEPSLSS